MFITAGHAKSLQSVAVTPLQGCNQQSANAYSNLPLAATTFIKIQLESLTRLHINP